MWQSTRSPRSALACHAVYQRTFARLCILECRAETPHKLFKTVSFSFSFRKMSFESVYAFATIYMKLLLLPLRDQASAI